MAPVVWLRSAVSVLGRFPAFAGVTLDASPGEIVLVQGPNGAGKSTLLRACAGLVPVVRGQAIVLGIDLVVDRLAVRREVAYVGHASGLYDEMTVADNILFWSRAAGKREAGNREALVASVMAAMNISPRLVDVPAGKLSAGQKRRVSLALAMSRNSMLWLLDEPHAGLDANGRDLFDASVRAAAHDRGVCVLMASHELERAASLADRTVTLVGGTVFNGTVVAGTAPAEMPIAGAVEPQVTHVG